MCFATSGKHLTTEGAGKVVVRETHSLIPAGGRHKAGGAKKESQRREGKREAGRVMQNPDKVLHTLGCKQQDASVVRNPTALPVSPPDHTTSRREGLRTD